MTPVQVDAAGLTELLKTRTAEIDALVARFAELIHAEESAQDMEQPGRRPTAEPGQMDWSIQ